MIPLLSQVDFMIYFIKSAFILNKGKKISGPIREVYVTDPGMEKDTTKWLTEIIFPIEQR